MQKPIVDTLKTKRKKSEHSNIENQLSYLPSTFKWVLKLLFNLIHKIYAIEYSNANKAILITTGQQESNVLFTIKQKPQNTKLLLIKKHEKIKQKMRTRHTNIEEVIRRKLKYSESKPLTNSIPLLKIWTYKANFNEEKHIAEQSKMFL